MTQAARLIVTDRRLGILLEQSIELVVHPAEPQEVLGLSRLSVERSGLRAVVAKMPVLFQPPQRHFKWLKSPVLFESSMSVGHGLSSNANRFWLGLKLVA